MENILNNNESNKKTIIEKCIQSKQFNDLLHALSQLMQNDQKIIYCKALLNELISQFNQLSAQDLQQICEFLIQKCFSQTKSYFEDEQYLIKKNLSQLYSDYGDYKKAVDLLTTVREDTINSSIMNINEKANHYLKITFWYFNLNMSERVDTYINKCGMIIDDVKDDQLKAKYNISFASSLDYNKKFQQAALKYYEAVQFILSNPKLFKEFGDQYIKQLLTQSTISAILAPAGPQRSRFLGILHKDELAKQIDLYPLLKKMYLSRIATKQEIDHFSLKLETHHKAQLEQFNVLQRAMIEHNIVAVSQIYESISIKALAEILQISETQSQEVFQRMINENRLKGEINQLTGFIDFFDEAKEMQTWNEQIEEFCNGIEKFVEKASKQLNIK